VALPNYWSGDLVRAGLYLLYCVVVVVGGGGGGGAAAALIPAARHEIRLCDNELRVLEKPVISQILKNSLPFM
jgi:2-polyprenyl-6-methoxyphenol hydroxylase-like FAD-dependent oxidoreductase